MNAEKYVNVEKYVRGRFPNVKLKTIKRGDKIYYVVKNRPSYTMISVGKTKEEAWEAAKSAISDNEPLCPPG